jgi:hypothetical protein
VFAEGWSRESVFTLRRGRALSQTGRYQHHSAPALTQDSSAHKLFAARYDSVLTQNRLSPDTKVSQFCVKSEMAFESFFLSYVFQFLFEGVVIPKVVTE